jgi:hypothetical protein
MSCDCPRPSDGEPICLYPYRQGFCFLVRREFFAGRQTAEALVARDRVEEAEGIQRAQQQQKEKRLHQVFYISFVLGLCRSARTLHQARLIAPLVKYQPDAMTLSRKWVAEAELRLHERVGNEMDLAPCRQRLKTLRREYPDERC